MSDHTARAAVLASFDTPFEVRDLEVGRPDEGGAIVSVTHGGICGTDLHLQHGRLPVPLPLVFGHEGVGRIEELHGEVADASGARLEVGDHVTWASSIPCGSCRACRVDGQRTLCPARRIYGINQRADVPPYLSGSWGERIVLQPGSTIVRLDERVSPRAAIALGCAGPTAVHGLEQLAGHHLGTVVVQGAGPVGIAVCLFARLAGAERIVLIGGPSARIEVARDNGVADDYVDLTVIADPEARREAVEGLLGGAADTVIEAAGVPAAVAESLDLVRLGGAVLVLGQYTDHGPTSLNPHLITRKQLRVHGSWAFAERQFLRFVRALPRLDAGLDLASLVTPFPLDEVNDAISAVAEGRVVKAALNP